MNRTKMPKQANVAVDTNQVEMRAQLHHFLARAVASKVPLPRARLGNEIWTVYLRLNIRLVDGQARRCLDVASCEIASEYQGLGLFSILMHVLQEADQTAYEVLYACEVQSPLVERWCHRHGWHLVEAPSVWPPSYYIQRQGNHWL